MCDEYDPNTQVFDPCELVWIRASDFRPWAQWDFEFLGEAAYAGASFYLPDLVRATHSLGPRSLPWTYKFFRRFIPDRFLRRFLDHSYHLDVLVLRNELAVWKGAAKWAALRLEVETQAVVPGEFGDVRIVQRGDGQLQCDNARGRGIPPLPDPGG